MAGSSRRRLRVPRSYRRHRHREVRRAGRPGWPGREIFRGSLVHSSAYRSGADYAGQDVLVAGFRNTGAEIAADLVESGANRVAVSVRTSPPIQRRDVVGIPIQLLGMAASVLPPRAADRIASALRRVAIGDLSRYGLGPAEWGPFTARRPPVIDVGFLRQLRARRVEILPAVERLTEREVVFADGRSEPFDAVVAATGFRNALADLVELDGEPARAPAGGAPWGPGLPQGLYVIGLRETVRGDLFETRRDSLALARSRATSLLSAETALTRVRKIQVGLPPIQVFPGKEDARAGWLPRGWPRRWTPSSARAFEALDRTASAHFIGGVAPAQRVAPVMPHKPIVPAGAPGELRLAQACLRAGVDAIQFRHQARAVEAPRLPFSVTRLRRRLSDAVRLRRRCRLPAGSRLVPDHVRPSRRCNPASRSYSACLLDETARVGVVVGGTYAMTESGIELLVSGGSIDLYTT